MKNKLEEQMSELMDAASLKELMPDFDKEALWQEVATQLPPVQEKKKVIPVWWIARAAAVFLIAAATWALLHLSGNKPVTINEIAHTQSQPSPDVKINKPVDATVTNTQSLTAKQTINVAPAVSKKASINATLQVQEIVVTQPAQQEIIKDSGTPILGTPAKQTAEVAVVPKKVTHYLDIDDDVSVNAAPVAVSSPAFIQMKLNKPGTQAQSSQQPPIKEFVLALAR